jgi:hypothetical protein
MVLYLDFDGVLHDEDVIWSRGRGIHMRTPNRVLFEWEPILVDLLEPHSHVRIVLSTSWVRAKSFNYAKNRLSLTLQNRIIGATFHSGLMDAETFARMPRGLQIWGDVVRRKPKHWFALDDDGFGWPAWCRDKLILTDDRLGLSCLTVQEQFRQRLAA